MWLAQSSSRFGRLSASFFSLSAALDPPLDALLNGASFPSNHARPRHGFIALHRVHREPVPGYKKEPDVLRSSLRLTPLSPPPRTPSRHAGASLTAARRRRTPPVRGHRRVTWKMTPNTDPLSPPFLFNGVRHDLLVLTIPSASSRTDRSRRRRRLSEESAGGSAARDAARGATTLAGGAAEAHVDGLGPPPPAGAPPSTAAALGKCPAAPRPFSVRRPRLCETSRGR
jgi:hypothetical protein